MMLSDVSVKRPVLAAVAAIVLCVVGVAAFFALPVRELPNIDPPIVSISTNYRGASAEVIESRITEVIERQVAGIQGQERISSTSRDGSSRISIEFSLDRDIDAAANDVRDAVSRVVNALPEQADAPQVAKADADAAPIMILFLSMPGKSRLEMTDYAERYLVERFSTVPGVANVRIFGEQQYAMRVEIDADALAARGLTVADIETALSTQNAELPAGYLEGQDNDFTIRVPRGYATAEQFMQLPISGGAVRGGSGGSVSASGLVTGRAVAGAEPEQAYVTRLGDVARVVEAANDRRRMFRGNGKDQIGLAITRQSQANDLEISTGVREAMEQVRGGLPEGSTFVVASDASEFTSEAIHEVYITIGIALALVALVNFLFLGTWRAAIIPTVVAPICLLATFIVLAPLGFSLNLLTLLALVLAIGLVVDDAIVVTENIQRRVDLGEPPAVAAQRGARQVFFAVVATTIVLLAVFAPLLFLPGYVGRLFVELAAAIAAAVAFSAFLALSLSPMLASKLLRPARGEGWIARKVDGAMTALTRSYRDSLQLLVGRKAAAVGTGALILIVGLAAYGLTRAVPSELVPDEDRGRIDIRMQGAEGVGYDYMLRVARDVEPRLAALTGEGADKPAERYLISMPGFGGGSFNSGNAVLTLKPLGERDVSASELAQRLNRELSSITGARVTASVRGPFQRGGGGGAGNSIEVIATGTSEYEDIARWMQPLLTAARDNPNLGRPRLDYEPNAPRLIVNLDREKAAALGVSAADVGRALETSFGSRRSTTYIRGGQEYDVLLQAGLEDRRSVQDLNTLYVRGGAGQLVPLSAVVTTELRGDTPDRRRLDRLRAITLSAELNEGYTLAEAVQFFEEVAAEQPPGPVIRWGGAARDLDEAGGAVYFAFGLALLLVFLALAGQFESWISPSIIMLTVPLAAAGGLFGLLMAGSSLNIYSQIGLIILVGVAAKNGILIVEFSNQLRDEGRSIRDAVIEASALRLRPIIMTSIATAFGALPLVLWQGAGAESRQTIGVVIFAGAIFSTLLTLFVVPVMYGLLARFTKSPEWTAKQIEAYEAEHGANLNDRHAPPFPQAAE